jgi:NADH-quinone oxidoreductase subunit L
MMTNTSYLLWIILVPIIGALLNTLFYFYNIKINKIPQVIFSLIGTITPFISFILTLKLFFILFNDGINNNIILEQNLFKWLEVDSLDINMALLGDKLSIFMAMFITFVGWLIHIYAIGYMHKDEGFGKFFAYFNLFLASMLILVLANNPIIMFIGWEGVGVCSYLLISFYYTKEENVIAGNKAFIVNRIGDFGLILGMVTLFFGIYETSFTFIDMEKNLIIGSVEIVTVSAFLLFIGAMGKSAQIPLHVWLPDAMAGPTPISALIHAATMVTAGVYMVARFHFLYSYVENVGIFIAYIGALSALFAAIIATKQTDIKKILAYSTMSQLGYMFIAVGLGFYNWALFHVFTHAFFKAMLFMGAGGIIIALHHEQNIFKIAQNRKKLPIISATFLIGVIAISGIPPFSGFFSKDAILTAAFAKEEYLIWSIAMITAFLTAFYMFRLYFILFIAPNNNKDKKYVYTSKTITIPLIILAIGSIFAGFLNVPAILGGSFYIDVWLKQLNSSSIHLSHLTEYILIFSSVTISILGIYIAYKKYARYDVYNLENENGIIGNKFYIDEIYDYIFVKSIKKASRFISNIIDNKIIDNSLMSLSYGFVNVSKKIITIKNSHVRYYTLYMLTGISIISLYLCIKLLGK